MRNKLPKFFVVTGTFFCCVSILVSITGMDAWAQPTPQGGQGKKCNTIRYASTESSKCQNGACPSTIKKYSEKSECLGIKSCYWTCEYGGFERDYEAYFVDEEWSWGGYTFVRFPNMAVWFECSALGSVVMLGTGIPGIVVSIPCNWVGNQYVLPPIDKCRYIKCKARSTPYFTSPVLVRACKSIRGKLHPRDKPAANGHSGRE